MVFMFDDSLKRVGDFSRFQHVQWLLLFLTTLPQAWYVYAPEFAAAKVKDEDVICTSSSNITGCNDNCTSFRYDVDFTSIATEWHIVCGDKFKIPLTKSIFYAGGLVGTTLFGWLSDRYGRRFVFFMTAIIQFASSLATTFSPNYYVYTLLRVPIGLCGGGNFVVAFLLATEMVGIKHRNWANGLIHCGYGAGMPLLAIFAYLVREWEYFNLVITLPNVFFILYWWWMPESPRWLAARGRTDEAEDILKKIAKTNKREYPEFLLENEIDEKKERSTPKIYHIWDLFKTRRLGMITCIEGFSWTVVGSVYFGLGFNSGGLSGNMYVNFALSGIVEIPAYLVASVVVNRIGRRIPLIAYLVIGGVALLSILPIVLTEKEEDLKYLVLTLTLIGKFSASASFYQLYIHTAELYPTVIRNIGVGFANMCATFGGMCASYIVDCTPTAFPYVVFGFASIVAGILSYFLPETMNKPLPEMDSII